MSRFFNTAGPCKPDIHYMLPPTRRVPEVRRLVDQQSYFVLHAPRQMGKTTALLSLADELTREGHYAAVLVSMEVGAAFPDDPDVAENAILDAWYESASAVLPKELHPPDRPSASPGGRIRATLAAWSRACPRPLVVFLDEIDALRDNVLLSVLRQLRDGHKYRPHGFPWSLALVGLRDVRDYKIASGGSSNLHTSSPFNVKTRSLTMREFTDGEVSELYAQHTADTGQRFEPGAIERTFELTQGQPWLVNALAYVLTEELVVDRSVAITVAEVDRAKEVLIERNDTHLDSLADRLRDPRVRRVIAPMLAGETLGEIPADDRQFVVDLGLVRRSPEGGLAIANPIYREVLPRALAQGPQDSLPAIPATWLTSDGALDTGRLLDAFLAFWRQYGEPLLRSAPYSEVAAQLVMMAFLQRVRNGGGTIDREYAVGRGRLDLCLRYGRVTLAIEMKVWRDDQRNPLREGLAQIDLYLAGLGLDTGWLVIFDQRSGLEPIEVRTTTERQPTPGGRTVTVIHA
jgi:hypothetical protein